MTMTSLLADITTGVLLSPWKAVLIFAPFIPWAWLIATKLEKDARYFHLNYSMWNAIYLASGVAALAAMLLIPWFFVGWVVGLLLLAGPVLAYWQVRNKAVPESQRFTISSESLSEKLEARRRARASKGLVFQYTDASGQRRNTPLKDDPAFEMYLMAEDLIGPALDARASRIDLAVSPKGCTVAQTIDGVMYKREPMPVESAIKLVDFVKGMAGLDVEDRRRQQRGRFTLTGPNGQTTVDLITAGSSSGQVARIEFDRANRLSKSFDSLGLLPSQIEGLTTLQEPQNRHGVVLVGAPSGHGLTTSLYSMVSRHDAFTSNVKSLERVVEVALEGVDQQRWDPTNPDVDYATNLQSILRRDPDIVMTSEVQDADTARVIVETGTDGPLIYVPQRAENIGEQIQTWVKQVGDVKKAVKPLKAVVNQRLLRSLCPNCRQAFQPSPDQLKKLNLPANKVNQLYRASGKVQEKNKIENCPVCGGTGYLGQTAAFEVFMVDEEARKILATGDLKAAVAHARRNRMIYLQEAAMSKVVAGETTVEEVLRVISPKKASGKAASTERARQPSPDPAPQA